MECKGFKSNINLDIKTKDSKQKKIRIKPNWNANFKYFILQTKLKKEDN